LVISKFQCALKLTPKLVYTALYKVPFIIIIIIIIIIIMIM